MVSFILVFVSSILASSAAVLFSILCNSTNSGNTASFKAIVFCEATSNFKGSIFLFSPPSPPSCTYWSADSEDVKLSPTPDDIETFCKSLAYLSTTLGPTLLATVLPI